MLKNKNKLAFPLVFLAIIGFLSISVGGEFLHNKIHHHKNESSHNQCPIYQLQAQVLVALGGITLALFLQIGLHFTETDQRFVFQSLHNLSNLRAPPVSLL